MTASLGEHFVPKPRQARVAPASPDLQARRQAVLDRFQRIAADRPGVTHEMLDEGEPSPLGFRVKRTNMDSKGGQEWFRGSKLHRDETEGPAVITHEHVAYYRNGKLHRTNAPAIEYKNGLKMWMRSGYLNREDGPAVIRPDGTEEYYINDRQVSKEEHAQITRRRL